MPAGFHARFNAKSKLYQYRIWNSRTRPLFEAPYVLWHPNSLNVTLMKRAAKPLVGRHDFRAFCDKGDEKDNFVRTIKKITIKKSKSLITIDIEGDGFLRHMVRIIVGTLIEAGRGKISPSRISQILKSKDRAKAGPTAKPLGLTLVKVNF